MNKQDRGILYGMSLGDGCISKQATNANYALAIGHGPKQQEYIQHKADKLLSIFGGKVVNVGSYDVYNKGVGKTYTNLQLRKLHPYFNQMHRNLYPKGKKVITRKVLDFLTDEGLAYWFMDDGCGSVMKHKKGYFCGCNIRIATYFSLEEALITNQWFQDRYKITASFDVDKRNGKVSLRFTTLASKVFAQIVLPYLLPSMRYKVDKVITYIPRVLGPTVVGEDIV